MLLENNLSLYWPLYYSYSALLDLICTIFIDFELLDFLVLLFFIGFVLKIVGDLDAPCSSGGEGMRPRFSLGKEKLIAFY